MIERFEGRPNKSDENEKYTWNAFLDWFPRFLKKKVKTGDTFIEGKANQEKWKAENEKQNVLKTDAESLSIIMETELKRAQCLAIYREMERDKLKSLESFGANKEQLKQFELKTLLGIQNKINQLQSLMGDLSIKAIKKHKKKKD